MPLDFLDFPFPVIKNLVDQMSPVDLVRVSLQSVRADNVLKACGKTNVSFFNLTADERVKICKFDQIELFLLEIERQGKLPDSNFSLYCVVSDDHQISIQRNLFSIRIRFEALENIEKFEGIRKNLKIGEALVPVVITKYYNEEVRTFWNDKIDGMLAFIDYFKNNFNLSIRESVFRSNDSKAVRKVVNHINSTQTVKKVEVEQLSEDDFKFILKNVSATDCFSSWLGGSKTFKFNGTIRAKRLYIMNGYWFTLKNLLISNKNEDIYVDGSNYTTEELRTFLREWASGKFPKLKKVELVTKTTWRNYLDVTKGFEKREDKCDYSSRRRPVVAIKGQGDFYGIVDPCQNRDGRFHMSVHNG